DTTDPAPCRYKAAADQLFRTHTHRLEQDPFPLPPRRLRYGLDRRGHSPPGVLYEPFAAQLPIPRRGRHRGRHVDFVDSGMGVCDPPGLLSIELVLCHERRDDRIGRLGRLESPTWVGSTSFLLRAG